jgi:pimeloyl-ACP methyl ester carboxylesterase
MNRRPNMHSTRARALMLVILFTTACATPVGVSRIDPEAAYRLHTVSALSEGEPSEASKMVLRRLGLMDRFEKEPAAVLAELHKGLGGADEDYRLFALADLSFLQGERTGDRGSFLASAVYAYALLFPGAGEAPALHESDPRLRLAYDLYNQGIAEGLAAAPPAKAVGKVSGGGQRGKRAEVSLDAGRKALPFGTLDLGVDPSGLTWAGYPLEHFVSTTTLAVRGLRNRYRRPGIGAPLAASLADVAAGAKRPVGAERIGARTKVPVTMLIRLEDPRASLASGRLRGHLELYAADQAMTVTIDGRSQPLEADPTAALAYQLEGNPLYELEIAGFLRAGAFANMLPRDRAQDGLFTLNPYQRGKIPVVLVHGTASSPTRWAELVNELVGDRRIRERFQIWIFMYDTGNPVGYSAGRLRAALTAAVHEFDPAGTDGALQEMVVIGHSQGGLLTKLTAIDTGTRLWDRISTRPFDDVQFAPETRALLKMSMFFTPLPFVKRVIFVSTPHHGALMAGQRLGQIASSLVRMPTTLLGQLAIAATGSEDLKLAAALRRPPTAIDNMNPSNPALQIVASIPVPPGTPAHSIIPVKGTGPYEDGNDGVVAYRSAHIDEAVSEKVVRWNHSVQGQPEAIEEIRRILLLHGAAMDAQRPAIDAQRPAIDAQRPAATAPLANKSKSRSKGASR